MIRSPLHFATVIGAASLAALASCSPENFAAAPDSQRQVTMVPTGDPSIPDPVEQSLAPVCAPAGGELIAALQEQINAERAALGRSTVAFSEDLDVVAQSHACDMVSMGRMTVAGSNGSSVVHRVRAAEYTACAAAQLIGRAGDPYAQAADWMANPAEEEIMTHDEFDEAGIGVVQSGGRLWWSLVLTDNCR
ncbi:CAP domain-containing protein [Paracoccus aerodenitrificans]|uniref:CAP domain-containing protein n=1 Tax=Paracoccus aerodenitrificans TaxID=3017781 RepID=UPI0022F0C64F|nr:CAP domain-containing protein [Paracoccus aerodenitrificans]WBU65033.1 CAP domain-containing protein [Paracoccus aerodenitrificans]